MAEEPEAQGGPHSAKREDAVVKGREKGNKGRKKESWWLRGAGNAAVNPRLGKGPGLWEAGQVRLKWGLAMAEGTPLAGVGSCVPKAGYQNHPKKGGPRCRLQAAAGVQGPWFSPTWASNCQLDKPS